MYNLVCENLKCIEKQHCTNSCGDCDYTRDLYQCLHCELYNECTRRSHFRIVWRSYIQHLGRDNK